MSIPQGPLVFDASSLIDLEGRLRHLTRLGTRVRIPERVVKEVNQPGSGLHRWLERHPQAVISFTLPQEEDMYLSLLKEHPELGDGEAQAISIAFHRHWTLVTDDTAARRTGESLGVPCINAAELVQYPQQGRFFMENTP